MFFTGVFGRAPGLELSLADRRRLAASWRSWQGVLPTAALGRTVATSGINWRKKAQDTLLAIDTGKLQDGIRKVNRAISNYVKLAKRAGASAETIAEATEAATQTKNLARVTHTEARMMTYEHCIVAEEAWV